MYVSGLPHRYVAAQLHFHWGSANKPGAEHTMDGEQAMAEVNTVNSSGTHVLEICILDSHKTRRKNVMKGFLLSEFGNVAVQKAAAKINCTKPFLNEQSVFNRQVKEACVSRKQATVQREAVLVSLSFSFSRIH